MRQILSTFSLITLLQLFPSSVYAQILTVDPVKNVISTKIMNNYPDGKFHSDKTITRAELAAIIVKTFRLDENAEYKEVDMVAIPQDVPESHWGYKHIQIVLKNGIMKGYKGNKFYPNIKVTRAEAFAIFAQAYGLPNFSPESLEAILAKYPDGKSIQDWARKPIAIALIEEFVNLKNGKIEPKSPVNRGDMVYAINKYLQYNKTTTVTQNKQNKSYFLKK